MTTQPSRGEHVADCFDRRGRREVAHRHARDGSPRRPLRSARSRRSSACEGEPRGSAVDDRRLPGPGGDRVRRPRGRRGRARSARRRARPAHLRRARGEGAEPGGRARRARDRRRRAGRDHVAERGPVPRRAVRRPRVRPGARPDQLPAEPRRGRATSSSTRARRCCSSTRSTRTSSRTSPSSTASSSAPRPTPSCSSGPARRSSRATDEHATATINYTSGTTARPKGVQMTHRNLWLNAVTFGWHMGVTDRDVYLHTLPMFHCNGWGLPFALTGMGARHVIIRKIDGDDILDRVEREGVTFLAGAPAVVAATLDAAARAPRAGRGDPRRGPDAHRRRGRAAAVAGDRAGRSRARLGVLPDLRAHRDVAAAHRQPRAARVRRRSTTASAPDGSHAPACPRSACACASTTKASCSRGRTTCSRATGSSPRRARRRSSTAGSAPATAASSTARTSSSRTARRT